MYDSVVIENQTIRGYLEGSNIWQEINSVQAFTFIDDPNLINLLFLVKYGSFPVLNYISLETVPNVASLLVKLYGERWNLLESNAISDIDSSQIETLTESGTNTEDRTVARTDTDKVSAYNSATLIDDSEKVLAETDGLQGSRNRTVTRGQKSLKALYDNLTLLEKTLILNTAMRDVANFMKLDIY